ncbi:MAG: class GN sortase [Pseudomonadota bacterium]
MSTSNTPSILAPAAREGVGRMRTTGSVRDRQQLVAVGQPSRGWRSLGALWRRLWLSPRRAIAAILLTCGLVSFGQGIFILVKAGVAQVLLSQAFDASLKSGVPVKPWSWADTWPVARLQVARLNAGAIALDGASGQALAFGPGHLSGTAEPGDAGLSVFAAHRDTHFSFLKDVVVGDVVSVQRSDGRAFDFIVRTTRIARFDAAGLDPHRSGAWLALTTCWPLDARVRGPMRLIIEAELVQ